MWFGNLVDSTAPSWRELSEKHGGVSFELIEHGRNSWEMSTWSIDGEKQLCLLNDDELLCAGEGTPRPTIADSAATALAAAQGDLNTVLRRTRSVRLTSPV